MAMRGHAVGPSSILQLVVAIAAAAVFTDCQGGGFHIGRATGERGCGAYPLPGRRELSGVSQADGVTNAGWRPRVTVADTRRGSAEYPASAHLTEARASVRCRPDPDFQSDGRRRVASGDGELATSIEGSGYQGPFRFVAPALVLMASAGILEGYSWLRVIPRDRIGVTDVAFALVLLPTSLALTGPCGHAGRRLAHRVLVATAVVLVGATLAVLVADRPWSEHLLGGSDLMLAAIALWAALPGKPSATPATPRTESAVRHWRSARTASETVGCRTHAGVVQRQNISFPS